MHQGLPVLLARRHCEDRPNEGDSTASYTLLAVLTLCVSVWAYRRLCLCRWFCVAISVGYSTDCTCSHEHPCARVSFSSRSFLLVHACLSSAALLGCNRDIDAVIR